MFSKKNPKSNPNLLKFFNEPKPLDRLFCYIFLKLLSTFVKSVRISSTYKQQEKKNKSKLSKTSFLINEKRCQFYLPFTHCTVSITYKIQMNVNTRLSICLINSRNPKNVHINHKTHNKIHHIFQITKNLNFSFRMQ